MREQDTTIEVGTVLRLSPTDDDQVYIYALCDPRDDAVRYIGQSGNPIMRLRTHAAMADGTAGPRTRAEIGIAITAHELRHLKARVLLNNGAHLAEVQDILGHNSIETTRRIYAHYTADHIQQAWQRYSRSAADLVGQNNDR